MDEKEKAEEEKVLERLAKIAEEEAAAAAAAEALRNADGSTRRSSRRRPGPPTPVRDFCFRVLFVCCLCRVCACLRFVFFCSFFLIFFCVSTCACAFSFVSNLS